MRSRRKTLAAAVAALALALVSMPPAAIAASAAAMPSDFNGDGYADLAIGVPGEGVGSAPSRAGAVNVLYGTSTGLTAAGDDLWNQDSPGVKGVSQGFDSSHRRGDEFGSALASGDFDRDGYGDLAIGVPYDDATWSSDGSLYQGGAVNVLYGTASGLTAAGDQHWTRAAMAALAPAWDGIGGALSSSDFDGDGYWDLAISGISREQAADQLFTIAGATILYGGPAGLTLARATATILPAGDVPVLASGDLDDDSRADLVIGLSHALVGGETNAGAVHVFYGTSDGVTSDRSQLWTQDSPGIEDAAEDHDHFGRSLVIGDFDADGIGDLAIGVPQEMTGTQSDAGAVNVIYGSPAGLTAEGSQLWDQDVPGVPDAAEYEDAFGAALAAGDFDGDGADDLAIGVPSEAPGTIDDENDWGAVIALYGGSDGLSPAGSQLWSQNSAGVPGTAEKQDAFGSSLAAANYGRSGRDDLAIGIPLEQIGCTPGVCGSEYHGMVEVLFGRSGGLSGTNAQAWTQDTSGVKGTAKRRDVFGSSLTP